MTDEKTEKRDCNRRAFMGAVAVVGAGAVLASCKKSYPPVAFVDVAPDGPVLKAGLIGCGSRGTGAAQNFLKAGPNLKIVALGDVLQDHLDSCRETLAKKAQVKVADDHCFIGFDAYKKVLEADVDLVMLATPPHFRPAHFDAAVDAKKHCFLEKPCAVDAPGVRSILATGQKAALTTSAWCREPCGGTTGPTGKPTIASPTAPLARFSGRARATTAANCGMRRRRKSGRIWKP